MNKAWLALALVVALLGAAILFRGDGEKGQGRQSADAPRAVVRGAERAGNGTSTLPAEMVLRIAPGKKAHAAAALPAAISPLMQEYVAARGFKHLHDRLARATQRSAEEEWLLAQILERCALFDDKEQRDEARKWTLGGEDSRRRFMDSLSDKDPKKAQRVAAFERINYDPCAGLGDLQVSRQEVRAMLERAALAGDPKARAELVRKDLDEQLRGADGKLKFEPGKLRTISDAQIEMLKQVVASGDPIAMGTALRTLNQSMQNLSLRAGPTEAPIEFAAYHAAVQLLACDHGYPCGPDSPQLLRSCALSGSCAAADYRDYLYYYSMSPSSSQTAGEYYQALTRAARERDWSYFTFHRGPSPWVAPYGRP